MRQWYRKTLTKVIVLLVGVISGAAFVTSLGVALSYAGTVDPSQITRLVKEPYEESTNFNTAVESSVAEVFEMFRIRDSFETEGAYDPDKTVDIMEYGNTVKVSGVNTSGVA